MPSELLALHFRTWLGRHKARTSIGALPLYMMNMAQFAIWPHPAQSPHKAPAPGHRNPKHLLVRGRLGFDEYIIWAVQLLSCRFCCLIQQTCAFPTIRSYHYRFAFHACNNLTTTSLNKRAIGTVISAASTRDIPGCMSLRMALPYGWIRCTGCTATADACIFKLAL